MCMVIDEDQEFPSLLLYCWLGNTKYIWPIKTCTTYPQKVIAGISERKETKNEIANPYSPEMAVIMKAQRSGTVKVRLLVKQYIVFK